jgi:hypothetical protein
VDGKPNRVLRRIREQELKLTRAELARAFRAKAVEIGAAEAETAVAAEQRIVLYHHLAELIPGRSDHYRMRAEFLREQAGRAQVLARRLISAGDRAARPPAETEVLGRS